MPTREQLIEGIAAYSREQKVLLRLLRFKGGSFRDYDFDRWFQRSRRRAPTFLAYTANTIILGGIWNASLWSRMLHLLQLMTAIGLVKTRCDGVFIVYSLPEKVD